MGQIEKSELFCGVVGAVCVISLAHIIGIFGFILGFIIMVGAYHMTR